MRLYLLGGGGHAHVVLDALRSAGIAVDGIVDPEKAGSSAFGLPVLRANPNEGRFLVTVGQIRATPVRERIWSEAMAGGMRAAEAFVDRTALVPATDVQVGEGSIVLAGALLGVGTRVGVNCIVNHRALIEHDCVVGDHAHVSPGAIVGGGVRIGRRSHVGIGAVIRQGITIGDDVTVGAGAVVVDDVVDGATVAGVPARPLARS